MDIGARTGASVVAANSGTVIKAEYNSSYGNHVVIDHGGGICTLCPRKQTACKQRSNR